MADNLSVAVTADTSELRAQLALAQADLRAFGAETRKLANDIRGGGDASGVLRGPLEQAAGQLGNAKAQVASLTDELKKVKPANDNLLQSVAATFGGFGQSVAAAREEAVGTFEKIQRAWLGLAAVFAGGALFGEAIRDVIQLDERVTNLQRTLGLDREAALQTDVALRLIGKSSDDYAHILLRLEQQVRTNEQRMNALGVATRDASGEYLKLPQIFQNALAAIQTYKAGTDQAGVAQELFRRSAAEMFGYMDLTPAIIERATEVIHQFGIELGDHEAMLQYRVNLAALGMAGEAVGHQIADQLMPPLSALSAWFTGPGAGAVRLFGQIMRGFAAEILFVQSAWQELVVDTQTAWDQIAEILRSAAATTKAILTGAWGEIEALSREHEKRMAAIAAAGAEEVVQIELRTARALEQIYGLTGAGGGEQGIMLPDVNVTGGTRHYSPPEKGGRARAGRAPKDTSDADAKADRDAAEERLKTEEKVDDEVLARRTKLIEAAYAAGKISLDQETALLAEQLDKKWALDQAYFAKKIAAAQGDDKEQQKLQDEELIAYQQYITKRQELDAKYFAERQAAAKKAAADEQAAFDKALAPIEKGFDQAIQGFLQGTQSLRQALQKGLQAIIVQPLEENLKNGLKAALSSAFSGSGVQNSIIGKFFSGTLFGGGAKTTGESALGTAATTAATQVTAFGTAISTATGALTGHVATTAASSTAVGANTVATTVNTTATNANSTAETAGAGGGLFGGLGGLFGGIGKIFGFERGGIVPSAAGGWMVPSVAGGGTLALLYSREMVLPAGVSQFIQSAAAGAGGLRGGGNNVSLTYAPTMNGPGAFATRAQAESFFRQHGDIMVGQARNLIRNGWRP